MNSISSYSEEKTKSVTFFFEGKELRGHTNEPIAKALFKAGVRTLSFSIKYHRPRGIHCMRGRCGMCHMEVDGMPGVPTCITPLEEGMQIRREDFRPFYGPLISMAANIIPLSAGFYYRMFTRPAFLRRFFMKNLRSMAGVGRIPTSSIKNHQKRTQVALKELSDRYDIVVVGGGISGMSAAISAEKIRARVLLVDEYNFLGGHSLGKQKEKESEQERDGLIDQVKSSSIKTALGTVAYGFYPPDKLLLGSGGSLKLLSSRAFIFATGSYDVVPLFKNNDLPGIFGEHSIRLLLERDGLKPGKRAIIFGNGEALRRCISLFSHHCIEIAFTGENQSSNGEKVINEMRGNVAGGLKLIKASGRSWVRGATFVSTHDGRRKIRIAGDIICTAFKGQPAYELAYQAGIKFKIEKSATDEERNMIPTELEITNREGVSFYLIGEASGEMEWRKKIAHARQAGEEAAARSLSHSQKEHRNG